jgi:hypothetical protein
MPRLQGFKSGNGRDAKGGGKNAKFFDLLNFFENHYRLSQAILGALRIILNALKWNKLMDISSQERGRGPAHA